MEADKLMLHFLKMSSERSRLPSVHYGASFFINIYTVHMLYGNKYLLVSAIFQLQKCCRRPCLAPFVTPEDLRNQGSTPALHEGGNAAVE
jgi:hypothetical protein